MTDETELWTAIAAERAELAELRGARCRSVGRAESVRRLVRDIVAHITMPFRARPVPLRTCAVGWPVRPDGGPLRAPRRRTALAR
jgi:hypothetical protein